MKHKVDIGPVEPRISSHYVNGIANNRNMKVLFELFKNDKDFSGMIIKV